MRLQELGLLKLEKRRLYKVRDPIYSLSLQKGLLLRRWSQSVLRDPQLKDERKANCHQDLHGGKKVTTSG